MKSMPLALLLAVFSATIAPALSARSAHDGAAGFPSKPVRWVVGFTPGASNDVIARTFGARLTEAATKFVREEAGRIRGLLQAGVLKQE